MYAIGLKILADLTLVFALHYKYFNYLIKHDQKGMKRELMERDRGMERKGGKQGRSISSEPHLKHKSMVQ